eukprot:CAMPEP_0197541318 /NCGR_PEP_ID=MMETSP1318-20131121/67094_1 /TAXON_ID=552666 /ORGANISM="Partenskyella glossopodia, Strain RCC365" /LENGTH=70 /DNA_ID=CAMNT_0043100481 /DNA_START=610 /DNA_END=819 /DNA_ORIENTATION=-
MELKNDGSVSHNLWTDALSSIRNPGEFLTEKAVEILMSPSLSEAAKLKLQRKNVFVPTPLEAFMLRHGEW